MPTDAPEQFFAEGIPVELGQINRELKKLWKQSNDLGARASRLNLVIFSAAEHSLRANTAIVEQIARQHAMRAILMSAKPQIGGNRVRAWINAHCQLSKSGAKQRCSEQIAFQFEGDARDMGLIPNLVFSHLDSDLPLFLWRQGEFSAAPNPQLLDWVDCLIYDSAEWQNTPAQFAIVERLGSASNLADLNWTRLRGWRVALAQFFDAPDALKALNGELSIEINHAPGSRMTALLLLGWLAAQIGWKPQSVSAGNVQFGGSVAVVLHEAAGPSLTRVCIKEKSGTEFTVLREANSKYLCASASGKDARQMLPVGPEEPAELVSEELAAGGRHRCYSKAMQVAAEIARMAA